MEQHISKSALIAEIKRLQNDEFLCDSYDMATGFQSALRMVQEFIDTLEVKEVDIRSEVSNWWNSHYAGVKQGYTFEGYSGHYMEISTIISLAQHFYELGMAESNKSQKGE